MIKIEFVSENYFHSEGVEYSRSDFDYNFHPYGLLLSRKDGTYSIWYSYNQIRSVEISKEE